MKEDAQKDLLETLQTYMERYEAEGKSPYDFCNDISKILIIAAVMHSKEPCCFFKQLAKQVEENHDTYKRIIAEEA